MKIKKKSFINCIFIAAFLFFNFQFSISDSRAQSPNTWVQKASFPGTPRVSAAGFSIGTKGYIGTGQDSSSNLLHDFWEYDSGSDTWSQRADFAGSARRAAVGFSIGPKGYIGTGFDGSNNLLDFWEYDPALNTWSQKRSLGTATTNPRRDAVAFSVSDKGYVATGYDGTVKYNKECWQFDGDTTWIKKADIGAVQVVDNWRRWAVGFAIDTNGYVGCGYNYLQDWRRDFWRFNPATNTWTQMANYGGSARSNAVAFSAQGKGYVGTGTDTYSRSDFWEFNPISNSWLQIADYPGGKIIGGTGLSINGSGYACLGRDSIHYRSDLWQYMPDSTIGVNDISGIGKNISVFPNPCADKLCFQNNSTYKIQKIEIKDAQGKAHSFSEMEKENQHEILTSGLSSGTYFLILQMEKGKVVKKFVKE